jgi:hypothetical protein
MDSRLPAQSCLTAKRSRIADWSFMALYRLHMQRTMQKSAAEAKVAASAVFAGAQRKAAQKRPLLRSFFQTSETATRARRYPAKPRPTKPSNSITQVEGSGTVSLTPL